MREVPPGPAGFTRRLGFLSSGSRPAGAFSLSEKWPSWLYILSVKKTNWAYGISYLPLRALPSRMVEVSGSTEMLAMLRDTLAGEYFRAGDATCCLFAAALCFSSSSPMLALRSETGIRLTRRSMRARRSFA